MIMYRYYNDPYDQKLDEIMDKIIKEIKKILNRFRFWFSKQPKVLQIAFYLLCGEILVLLSNDLINALPRIDDYLTVIFRFGGDYLAYKVMQLEKVDSIEDMKK